jgi:hypothetical protein
MESAAQTSPTLRWWIGGILFASTAINYVDRQTILVLAPYLRFATELYNQRNSRSRGKARQELAIERAIDAVDAEGCEGARDVTEEQVKLRRSPSFFCGKQYPTKRSLERRRRLRARPILHRPSRL